MGAESAVSQVEPEIGEALHPQHDPIEAAETDPIAAVEAQDHLPDTIPESPQHFLAAFALLAFLFIGAIVLGNRLLSPWYHMPTYTAKMAETLLAGTNFGVFDLNVDIRGIRRAQFAAMTKPPEVMILGASHWQEASADLMPRHQMFNAHVHRDYYDDVVAAVGLLVKNELLPRRLVIAIRDNTFTSVNNRTDYLWLPFIPDYREAEKLLNISPRLWTENIQTKEYSNLFSLSALVDMTRQWLRADEIPGPTPLDESTSLDLLMPDGSIRWSRRHKEDFTPARARRLALEMAQQVRDRAPELDSHATNAIAAALRILREKEVEVVLVHPPFNPIFYDAIRDSRYHEGLKRVAAHTRRLAESHGATVAGSFNPREIGCLSSMYIDAEHSNPDCLGRLLSNVAEKFTK